MGHKQEEINALKEGKITREEVETICREYHDWATREDFQKIADLLKRRLGVEMKVEPEISPPNYQYIEFYRKPVIASNAEVIVETGTGAGRSCNNLVWAAKKTGGHVYSVDNYPDHISVEICKERHLSQGNPVTFIIGDSIKSAKKWWRGDIDLLYLDAGHTYEFVSGELEAWGQYNPKVILVHDTLEGDAGTQGTPVLPTIVQAPYWASKEYAKKYGLEFININGCFTGMGVIA